MGHLAISSIYLKSDFTPAASGEVTGVLYSICKEVQETRKGRHWEIVCGMEELSSLVIHVHKTEDYLWEIEEEMNELKITTRKFPEVIKIVSALGRKIDKDHCQLISDAISVLFDGISKNATLKS